MENVPIDLLLVTDKNWCPQGVLLPRELFALDACAQCYKFEVNKRSNESAVFDTQHFSVVHKQSVYLVLKLINSTGSQVIIDGHAACSMLVAVRYNVCLTFFP